MGLSRQAKSKISRQTHVLPPLTFAVGGALPMAHARKSGTAWDRKREDYAHTRELEGTGWAWEFLRRNVGYRDDFLSSERSELVLVRLPNGATLYKLPTQDLAAEGWGLSILADPDKTALAQDLFWLPAVTTHTAICALRPASDGFGDTLSLGWFTARTAVLLQDSSEVVTVRAAGRAATILVVSGSVLAGPKAVSFSHEGFQTLSRHVETLRILQQLMTETPNANSTGQGADSKYLSYLIALDGHLEGRSYRDVAEVIFGKERVGRHWTDDTRWMKSKVRRAVERGIALMNGGYRDLL